MKPVAVGRQEAPFPSKVSWIEEWIELSSVMKSRSDVVNVLTHSRSVGIWVLDFPRRKPGLLSIWAGLTWAPDEPLRCGLVISHHYSYKAFSIHSVPEISVIFWMCQLNCTEPLPWTLAWHLFHCTQDVVQSPWYKTSPIHLLLCHGPPVCATSRLLHVWFPLLTMLLPLLFT